MLLFFFFHQDTDMTDAKCVKTDSHTLVYILHTIYDIMINNVLMMTRQGPPVN